MMISIFRLIGALGAVMVTTAAVPMCNSDSASASTQSAANTTSATTSAPTLATTAGPGLPADFPLAPGLSACKPIVVGGETVCEWHGVDGHAIYTFYHDALPEGRLHASSRRDGGDDATLSKRNRLQEGQRERRRGYSWRRSHDSIPPA